MLNVKDIFFNQLLNLKWYSEIIEILYLFWQINFKIQDLFLYQHVLMYKLKLKIQKYVKHIKNGKCVKENLYTSVRHPLKHQ